LSNVLIGIIGVILFIGLALAGALILGSDFLVASSSSKAAAIVQGLQQSSDAYAMNTLKTGAPVSADQGGSLIDILIAGRRLKSRPVNPFNTVGSGGIYGADDVGQLNPAKPMKHVIMTLGPTGDRRIRDACYAIEEQMGSSNPELVDTAISFQFRNGGTSRIGCMLNSFSNLYIAYAPL